jgi:hypothetical protein
MTNDEQLFTGFLLQKGMGAAKKQNVAKPHKLIPADFQYYFNGT